MTSESERFRATPKFESVSPETASDVGLIMECGLVSVMRGDRVAYVEDGRGPGWLFTSSDERFAVEARPIRLNELAGESDIRAYLRKRGEWFSKSVRVFMTAKRDIPYWDQDNMGNSVTQLLSTFTFEIPFGVGQLCRWTGLTGDFRDRDGVSDPKGEEIFVSGLSDPTDLDAFIISCASQQVGESCSNLLP